MQVIKIHDPRYHDSTPCQCKIPLLHDTLDHRAVCGLTDIYTACAHCDQLASDGCTCNAYCITTAIDANGQIVEIRYADLA